jgi:hypothetical protein
MVAVSDSCLVLPGLAGPSRQQHCCWIIGHACNPCSQLHQLAYSTAEPAEVVYQRELN